MRCARRRGIARRIDQAALVLGQIDRELVGRADELTQVRAVQLQRVHIVAQVVGTLQGAKVFNEDNYETLITKAALHGARLLKKPHQATAVMLASHLWWQEVAEEEEAPAAPKEPESPAAPKEDGVDSPKAVGSLRTLLPTGCLLYTVSTHTKIVSVSWNACKKLFGSQTRW